MQNVTPKEQPYLYCPARCGGRRGWREQEEVPASVAARPSVRQSSPRHQEVSRTTLHYLHSLPLQASNIPIARTFPEAAKVAAATSLCNIPPPLSPFIAAIRSTGCFSTCPVSLQWLHQLPYARPGGIHDFQ
ncbi:hypothetical protein E2C01_062906 [Portunus trituberculatus]|uniref:Uncharacterized protein n=1 Tax=Portunus trituberculatus TaxID=210409 RepID=A0A5B7HCE2_PORTR|nr:hypothetical protein [Portunus trituberculatus]